MLNKMKCQPKQVQKHLMTFSIIVHTTPKKVNQSLDYHHKIPVKSLKLRNINTKFNVEVLALPETTARRKIEAEHIEVKSQGCLQI